MTRSLRFVVPLGGLVLIALCAPVVAEPAADATKSAVKKPAPGKFIRIKRDAQGQPVALETATVRYLPASGQGGLVVDLVSAVHVADKAYYGKLNDQMDKYDVLLYELVAPQGTRIPRGGKRKMDNPLAMVQQLMKLVLDLDSQTEQIDYTRKNFVHADLSPEEMAKAIRERGDDGATLFLSIAADMLRKQNLQEMDREKKPARAEDDPDLFSALLGADGPVKLKRALAEQFAALETPGGGLGQTLNTILISDRNKAALRVFQKELAKGKKKIGIFYGAAHMPDFEKRLREDFGLKRESEQWLTAWDIRTKEKGLDSLIDLLKLLGQ